MSESAKNDPISYVEKLNTIDIGGKNIDDNKKESQDIRERALSFLDGNLKNIPDNYKINLINEIVDLLEKLENTQQDILIECRNRLDSLNKNIIVNKESGLEEEIEKMDFTGFNEEEIVILKDVSRFLDITKLTKIKDKERLMKFLMTDIVKPIIITQIGDLLDYKIINNDILLDLIKKDDSGKIIAKMSFEEINKLISSGILDKELNGSNDSTNLEKIYEKVKNDPEKGEIINFLEKNSYGYKGIIGEKTRILKLSNFFDTVNIKNIKSGEDLYKLINDEKLLGTSIGELIFNLNLFKVNKLVGNDKKAIFNEGIDAKLLDKNKSDFSDMYSEILEDFNATDIINCSDLQFKNTIALFNKCLFPENGKLPNFNEKSDISNISLDLFFQLLDIGITCAKNNLDIENNLTKIKGNYEKKYVSADIKESIKNLNNNEKVFLKKYLPKNTSAENLKDIQKDFDKIIEKYSIENSDYPDLFNFKEELNTFFKENKIDKEIENIKDILNLRTDISEDKLNQNKLYEKNKVTLEKLSLDKLNEIKEKLVNPSFNLIELKKELLSKYGIELNEETSLEEIKELFKQFNELKTTKNEKKLAEKNGILNQDITQDNTGLLSDKLGNTRVAVEKLMANGVEIDQKFLESENGKKILEATKLPKEEFEKKLAGVQELIMGDKSVIKNTEFKNIPELAKYSNEQGLEIQKGNNNGEIVVEMNGMKNE
ncbi:MAG: hypothetical protein PHZ26_02690, partial [Candidatus Gracilibacteria bacterium]|nr:hypothetical protein [Candidatus Gracilibacteria bacterium]